MKKDFHNDQLFLIDENEKFFQNSSDEKNKNSSEKNSETLIKESENISEKFSETTIEKNENSSEKKLAILVDGSSFIYRAFYALPQLTNPKGDPVGAIYGFCSMLISLLNKHESDLFCVALDAGRDTFRKKFYPEYKNNREETPAELKSQFPILIQACKAFGIPLVELAGYEADDIIATFATKLSQKNFEVRIIASDKDLMQLISENIYLFDPMKSKIIKEKEVFEKYGVYPNQMIALQTLMGDKTDNIPGIDGVGPKTAAKLIHQFGSVDNIYNEIEKVSSQKIKEKLIAQKDQLKISEKLVTLCRDVPIDCDFSKLKINLDIGVAKNFLSENNFNSLIKRFEKQATRIEKQKRKYIHFSNANDFKIFMQLNHVKKFSIFSTTCFNQNQVLAICFANQVVSCFFAPQNSDEQNLFSANGNLSYQEISEILKPYIEDESIIKIGIRNCLKLFPKIKSFNDVSAMSYLLYGVAGNKISDLFPGNDSYICKFSLSEICNAEQACLFAELIFDEFDNLQNELEKNGLFEVYKNIDMPLLPILNSMETKGILISKNKLFQTAKMIEEKIKNLEKEIFSLAGYEFNPGSGKQLSELFFEKLKLPKPSKKNSMDIESLEELYEYSPIPKLIVEWRKLSKLISTYTYSLCDLLNPKTQRLHTTFHAKATTTGRLSSSNPNLQNIPYKTEMGKEIRHAFVSPNGFKLMSFDYSQIELRILAHMANIKFLQESFSKNLDIHQATASQIFDVDLENVTPEMRARAKTINFGIVYGMSPIRLSKNLNIPFEKAKSYIENYFAKFPEFDKFKNDVLEFARKNGYVKTITGRRCYIKDILSKNFVLRQFSERQAVNAVVQGTAADIVKIAMIKIYPHLEKLHSSMIIQIHDELVFETQNEFIDENISVIKNLMENAYELSVPLKVNVEYNDFLS